MSPGADQTPETKGAQTRRAILQAAITRFGRDGFRATSVADIARDAAVGGTVAYAYFPNKEALFLAAVDDDAAGVIQEGLATVLDVPDIRRWHDTLIFTLVEAVEHHPLAPPAPRWSGARSDGSRARDPALNELRKACTEMLRTGQAVGDGATRHRPDGSRQRHHRSDAGCADVGHPDRQPGRRGLLAGRGGGVRGGFDGTQRARITAPGAVSAQVLGANRFFKAGLIYDPDVNVKLLDVSIATADQRPRPSALRCRLRRSPTTAGSRWRRSPWAP